MEAVLLHEMCHIGCSGHGARFRARIRRLIPLVPAPVGAHLRGDLEVWTSGQTLRGLVWDALDSLAMQSPDTPWATVRRLLVAHELPSTFDERERRRERGVLRWARREWSKLSRLYAEIAERQRAAASELGEH